MKGNIILKNLDTTAVRVLTANSFTKFSKNKILKFSLDELNFYDIYYLEKHTNISKQVWCELIKLYRNDQANIEILEKELKPALDDINKNCNRIIPLIDLTMFLKNKIESKQILKAPILVSLNVILRSTRYAFLPHREISFIPELIRREFYSFEDSII
ncbi:MAG: hypothetical protein ABDH23_04905 [Endomicrobiia bacterium]